MRFFRLSQAGLDIIRRAYVTYPVSVLQTEYSVEYSVFERTVESQVLPVVWALGIGFVACSRELTALAAGNGIAAAQLALA